MNLLNSLQPLEIADGEYDTSYYIVVIWGKEVPNFFTRNSYFISASQNGKFPPLPRSSENNGIVSIFLSSWRVL